VDRLMTRVFYSFLVQCFRWTARNTRILTSGGYWLRLLVAVINVSMLGWLKPCLECNWIVWMCGRKCECSCYTTSVVRERKRQIIELSGLNWTEPSWTDVFSWYTKLLWWFLQRAKQRLSCLRRSLVSSCVAGSLTAELAWPMLQVKDRSSVNCMSLKRLCDP